MVYGTRTVLSERLKACACLCLTRLSPARLGIRIDGCTHLAPEPHPAAGEAGASLGSNPYSLDQVLAMFGNRTEKVGNAARLWDGSGVFGGRFWSVSQHRLG